MKFSGSTSYSPLRRAGLLALSTIAALSPPIQAASYSPTLDLSDVGAVASATVKALENLMSYYVPSATGVFDQVQTPWHASCMIYCLLTDHAKWTGDVRYMPFVTSAFYNISYGQQQDFLGGPDASYLEKIQGRWNDDILWGSLAITGAAEIYGYDTTFPGAAGNWLTAPLRTVDQVWDQWDDVCNGGIYWSRDRNAASAAYKSLITNVEFIQQAARIYIGTQNQTVLDLAKRTVDWVQKTSGLASEGALLDGTSKDACGQITENQFTYNYGMWLGGLAWMHKATGDQQYLDMSTPYLDQALATFAGDNSTGVINEQCETSGTCNRDQQDFKATFTRNLVYLYRETSDTSVKSKITNVITTSLTAMIDRSCDQDWNCGGNWTTDTEPVRYIRSQHVSASLLVSYLGIIDTSTGPGLLTSLQGANNPTAAVPTYNPDYTSSAIVLPTAAGVYSYPLDTSPSSRTATISLLSLILTAILSLIPVI